MPDARGSLVLLVLAGCAQSTTPTCDAPLQAGASIRVADLRDLDLLFVVDDSSSMAEEQASLAAQIPGLLRALTSGDVDGDGEADVPPVRSIHVGVVTTDMGSGDATVATCDRPSFGGDGRMVETCEPTGPAFLAFDPGADALGGALACRVGVGTGGCGIEQPLEAALKALSPGAPASWTAEAYLPPTFYRGTAGHGDGAHDGFARVGAVLAVVPFTDEDDCSVADPALFDPESPAYAGTAIGLRCALHPEALHPIERFVEGLLGLRWRPGMLVFAPVVGIPADLAPAPGSAPDYDLLIGPDGVRDPRMLERVDPDHLDRLVPSCDVPGRGQAFPPVRLVQTALQLEHRGAATTVLSICQDGLLPLVAEIARRFGPGGSIDCISRTYRREPDRSLACTVELELAFGTCESVGGATPALDAAGAPRTNDGRPICELQQRVATEADVAAGVAPAGEGWWYDEHLGPFVCGDPPSRIAVPELPHDTQVTLRCAPHTYGSRGLAEPCDPDDAGACAGAVDPDGEDLACVRGACAVPCDDEYDCRRAFLVDAVCLEGACAPAMCTR